MSEEMNSDGDDLHDRLIDRTLRELVGGETPPDLSDRILATAGVPVVATLSAAGGDAMQRKAPIRPFSRFRWASLAMAAALLVGAAFLLLPALQSARESAQNSPSPSDRKQIGVASRPVSGHDARKPQSLHGETAEGQTQVDVDRLTDLVKGTTERFDSTGAAAGQAPAEGREDAAEIRAQVRGMQLAQESGQQSGGEEKAAGKIMRGVAVLSEDAPADRAGFGLARQPADAGSTSLAAVDALAFHDQLSTVVGADPNVQFSAPEGTVTTESLAKFNRRHLERGALSPQALSPPSVALGVEAPFADDSLSLEGELRAPEPDRRYAEQLSVRVATDDWDHPGKEKDAAGRGPALGGDQYARIIENPFRAISAANTDNRLSTFSIDVDTASYANVRQFLMASSTLPPPDAVRIEELVNYFDYDYSAPTGDVPFAQNVEVAACPWAPEHRLVRIGIKGREMERRQRPKSNLVFLIDVSGSMDEPNKLPLLLEGMKMLTRELGENDRVAIVVYASQEGLALASTRGDKQQEILDALAHLSAGGSTAGGAGIVLAYKTAEENFIKDGVNRVILCTDGDFNVGVTSPADLQRLAEDKAKNTGVFLTVLGFGRGNLNDAMMEAVADHGNGNYHYVDNQREARKVLVEEMTGTLVTIAKDVKIQVEFNPAQVAGYRLIGYENRVLAAEDFNDDKKDAGEIGAGHTVTALYEVVPAGKSVDATKVDELKYSPPPATGEAASAAGSATDDVANRATPPTPPSTNELLTLKIRYKQPTGDTSEKLEFPIADNAQAFGAASQDFQFAASVASFGMILRNSEFKGDASLAGVAEIAESASRNRDPHGYRKEFVAMVRRARELSGQ